MTFTVVENVRGFFGSRPPLVVFMIFLGSVAVGFITFAYIIKVKDMPESDIAEDWNTFLERVSGLKYCLADDGGALVMTNVSQPSFFREALGHREQLSHAVSRMRRDVSRVRQMSSSTSTSPPTSSSANNLMNVSIVMDLELFAVNSLFHMLGRHNITVITTTLRGSQLGRNGHRRDMEANLTMVLPAINGSRARNCNQGRCYRGSVCVTLTAPRSFFPHTQQPEADDMCPRDLDIGGENHFHLLVITDFLSCSNGSRLTLRHSYNPTLTAVTTMDRSAINLHLMHSSYFLFVMVVTVFCYAIIKGRPAKVKVVYAQCPSEKHAPSQV